MRAGVSIGNRVALVVVLLTTLLVPAGAGAVGVLVAPVMTIDIDPTTPDGLSGWWLAAPDVALTSDQAGTAFYSYSGGAEESITIAAGVPSYLLDVPEGVSLLSAYAVNSGGETQTPPATASLKVDSIPPSRPLNASWDFVSGNTIALDWDASTDTASGVRFYAIYRNLDGPPFGPADLIDLVETPGYDDTAFPPVSGLNYAIECWDVAGNISLMSDTLVVDVDVTPPTAPSDVQAWLNAAGWGRVSWSPAFDAGSGMSHYLVYRSVDGGGPEFAGTAPASVTYFDDHDPALEGAASVYYTVVAVDRAGLESGASPVPMGHDVLPPVAPAFTVAPTWSGDSTANDAFVVDWSAAPATDVGSGVLFYEVRYGSDPAVPTASIAGGLSSASVPFAEEPATLLYFRVRAQDRAGNIVESGQEAGRNIPAYNLAGADRIATSVRASEAGFDSAATVVFASGYNYPDALCAAPLAAKVGGPLLLAGTGAISPEMLAELGRLGAANALVIGGDAAVSPATFASIDLALGGTVRRIAGPTRYETAVAVANELGIQPTSTTRAYIVTGEKFPDALSVGSAAFAGTAPILFARAGSVPAPTLACLQALGVDETVIVGGVAAVTPAAEDILPVPTRIAGANRYATAREFAEWAIADGVLVAGAPCVATGVNFPDGLTAGPLAGSSASPVLLTSDSENAATIAWLASRRTSLARVWTLGGPSAIDARVTSDIWAAVSVP